MTFKNALLQVAVEDLQEPLNDLLESVRLFVANGEKAWGRVIGQLLRVSGIIKDYRLLGICCREFLESFHPKTVIVVNVCFDLCELFGIHDAEARVARFDEICRAAKYVIQTEWRA